MPSNSGQRTGSSTGAYAMVAYDSAAGARLWASCYYGPGNSRHCAG